MTELDRFTEFLRRESAGYNEPPEAPSETMWTEIESRLVAAAGEDARTDVLDHVVYNEPPAAPREAMWNRIEAAWTLRRSAPAAAREAGLDPMEAVGIAGPRRRERRTVALWITGVAVAASLIIGVGLGRGSLLLPSGEPMVATAPPQAEPAVTSEDARDPTVGPEPPAATAQPLETNPRFVVEAGAPPRTDDTVAPTIDSGTPTTVAIPPAALGLPGRREAASQYATSEHLGRAATLLTAFRTDASAPAAQGELAGWARRLLGETRLLLDMDVTRSSQERTLLQDLELTLAQIARLGPGAPDFERELIQEGMERQGTLTRLRSAATAGT